MGKSFIGLLITIALLLGSSACSDTAAHEPASADTAGEVQTDTGSEENTEMKLTLTINGETLTATLAENSTVDALIELLREGPLTLDMEDYAGFEKGAPLPRALPQNNEPMDTDAGDIILYQGTQFVIYYGRNSWSLTPIGKIDGITKTELTELLGTGDVQVTISLAE